MELKDSLKLIQTFFKDTPLLIKNRDEDKKQQLESEKCISLPVELAEYIDTVVDKESYYFETVGNPIELIGKDELSWKMLGYNFNPVTNKIITDWNDNWFLIANEGGDPIIVDLEQSNSKSVVYKAMHGVGDWDFEPIANSIAEFLLYCNAVHHALHGFNLEDAIIDDNNGFNLAEKPGKWLFPFMETYADEYYEDWVSIFDNS